MKNPEFKLLDVVPVTTRKHSAQEIALAKAGISKLRKIRMFYDVNEIVKEIIDGQGVGEAKSALEDALKSSAIYKEWQDSMPFLRDVPNIHSYRTKPKHKNNIVLVNDEINKVGGLLPKNQFLFRGGNFQKKDMDINDGPISTTTMPCVARWHAVEVNGQIAILRIAQALKIKAFAFKTRGNQKLKQEYEVLLQNGLCLKFIGSFAHQGMEVIEYEVYIA